MNVDRQHPVTFVNRDGHRLFGIVHEPLVAPRRDIGIILLSPGVKNRVAPHRLYNKMAAAYVSLGFWVLRFDFYGLGDSEGSIEEPLLADLYGSIQTGRYIDDTRVAMEWMSQAYGIKQFVLGGLCGGAITGILGAAGMSSVAGILGLGVPVMLDGSNVDKLRNMTTGQLTSIRERYWRKLLDPSSWLRLLTMKTDFRLLLRALATKSKPATPVAAPRDQPAQPIGNANPHFPAPFLNLLAAGRPVLLVFSAMDRLYAEFEEKFLQFYRARVDEHSAFLDVAVIDQANHTFTFTVWQEEMLQRSRQWLQARFPPAHETVADHEHGRAQSGSPRSARLLPSYAEQPASRLTR